MKKYFILLLTIITLCLPLTTYANEFTVTNDNVLIDVDTIKEVDITSEKGSTFTVEIPILSKVSSTFDWTQYKYCDIYWSTSAQVYGDIDSNEQIRIEFDEDVVMIPDGGLKENLIWTAAVKPKTLNHNIFDATELTDNHIYDSAECRLKPNKNTTAGLWRGYVTVRVFLEPKEYILTAEQFKQYIENDTTIESITIPATIKINNKEYNIVGVGDGCFNEFVNLKDIYLSDVPKFTFHKAFYDTTTYSFQNDITIHGNTEVYLSGYADMDISIKVDGCTLFLAQNPFNGWNGTPATGNNYYHYNETNQYNFEDIIGGDCILGAWDNVTLNPNVQYLTGNAFQHCFIEKLTIPELKYADGSFWSIFNGCEVKEVECDNYFIGDNWFSNCTLLNKVTLTDNVEYIGKEAFSGCTSLTEVIIPESVKYIDFSAFNGTPFFENLKKGVEKIYINGIFLGYGDLYEQDSYYEFPANIDIVSSAFVSDKVTHLAFEESDKSISVTGSYNNIKTLDVTGRNGVLNYNLKTYFPNVNYLILGGKTKYSGSYEKNYTLTDIDLVDGLEVIGDYAFNHVENYNESSIYIPASVYGIGGYSTTKQYPYSGTNEGRYGSGWSNHVFYNFGKDGIFKEFIVDEDSEYYTTVDGILYTKDLQALAAIPRATEFENGIFTLPNEVKRLGELSFSRNKNIKELVISDNLEIFNNVTDIENYYNSIYCDYISCLNEGNSLSIATYQFTDIQKYTTRDTNPNYISVDGILYTKDLKELVAVPNHYQGAINIPEGCETIRENAFWLDYDSGDVHNGITSISIPSTMTNINSKQMDYINKRWGWAITIAHGNNVYTTMDGKLINISTIENRQAWNGNTGTYWYRNTGDLGIGSDPAAAWARYVPMYIPEGIYSFEVTDTTYGVPQYHIIFGGNNWKTTSAHTQDASLRYSVEKGYFAVEDGGTYAFMSMQYVNNKTDKQAVGDINAEMANALLNSMEITKIADIPITPGIGWSISNNKVSRTVNDKFASLRTIRNINNEDTYILTLSNDVSDYSMNIFGFDVEGNIIVDTGWISINTPYTLSRCYGYTINFKNNNDSVLTYEDSIKISNALNIIKLENHIHDYTVIHTDADCVHDGSDVYSCNCGHTYADVLSATGHSCVDNVCTICGGYDELTILNEAGYYDEYGRMTYSWEELVSNNIITLSGTFITKCSTELTETLIVKDGITAITSNAFSNCKIKKIVLPNTITEIRYQAFANCYDLKEINLPEGLTNVGQQAFWHCEGITELILPSTLTTVEREAFCFCRGVETLIVPSNLTTFTYREFCWMNNLKEVYFEHTDAPIFGDQLFSKWGGVKTTFYFKNQEVADAFTTAYYQAQYGEKSTNYDW